MVADDNQSARGIKQTRPRGLEPQPQRRASPLRLPLISFLLSKTYSEIQEGYQVSTLGTPKDKRFPPEVKGREADLIKLAPIACAKIRVRD
jgi:hypothetical protein